MVVQRIKEQTPGIVVLAVVVVAAAVWLHHENIATQQLMIVPLREQNDALRVTADDNRRQLEATTALLKNAISKRDADLFRPDEEVERINGQRIDALADAIAKRVQPAPPPHSSTELKQMEDEQVERLSTRTAEKVRPMLADLATRDGLQTDEKVRSAEARNAQLTSELRQSQMAAQEAVHYSQELGQKYVDTFRDQAVLPRIMTLPGQLINDTAHLNLATNRDQAKARSEVAAEVATLEKRIEDIQAQALAGGPN